MSNNESVWVKDESSVLREATGEEQTMPFQITMPYVVLQIMQRLEPNHSVEVNASTSSSDKRLNISCTRSSNGDEVVFSLNGVDMDPDVVDGMSAMGETISGPVFSSSLDVPAPLCVCDTDVLPSMSSVTNDVIFNDSGDSQPCRMYPSSDFTTVDVMKDCSEIEIVHGSDSAAAMLDSDSRLAGGVGAVIEPLFSADRDILSSTADSVELMEPNTGSHTPLIRYNVTAYRCALCTCLSYSLDRAILHAKRQHAVENANAGAVDIVPELLQTVCYCRICEAPSRTTYHWQSHMRRRHHVNVDRRRKPGADPRIRERKRLASLKDKSFVPIECIACGRQMRLTESYYLHIKRSHCDDGSYTTALAHLDEVRRARREKSSCQTIAVTPCPFCGVRVSSVRHLMLVHPKEPNLEAAITATRNKLRNENIQQRKARAAAKVECAHCGRRMSRFHTRTHLQYHCANVIPELNMSSSELMASSDVTSNNILSIDPAAIPDDCNAVTLAEDELREVQNAVECEMASTSADDTCSGSGPLCHQSMSRIVTCIEPVGNSDKVCGKRLNAKAYNSHRRKFHSKGEVQQSCCCPFCDRKFWDRYYLQRHLTVHTYEKVIVCLMCQRTFMHQFSYSEHFQKTHLRHFLHTCESCGRGFWKRTDKTKHRCKPENRSTNIWNNEQLQLKAKQLLDNWQGPLYVEMNRTEASDLPPPLKRQVVKKAWRCVLCILCNKTFGSMRSYQLHHKHCHLLEFDHECSACGLCFPSRHSFQVHNCIPHRRRVNIKKREVLFARMHDKMQQMSEPYFAFVDSENQVMPYADNSKGSCNKEVLFEQSFSASADSTRADEANSNCSVDRPENEDANESGLLQNDLFHLTENSSVLSCLPKCEQELLHSAAMETLSADLEMDVCDSLELEDDCISVEQSAATAVSDASDDLLADVDEEQLQTENGIETTVLVDTDQRKNDDAAIDPDKTQQWPMATLLSDGRLQCKMCQKELRVANYYPHMRRVHKMASSQSRPITWKVCDRCGYQCQDNYKLRRHVMKHTKYAAGAVLCELCDRLFHERMDYKHHFKRCHLGQFNIRCDACCKGFWKTSALNQHTCYPEMRDENIRMQHEREEAALHQRSEIRASMGLGDGVGIDVVNVVETDNVDNLQDAVQSKSNSTEVSSQSACDSAVSPAQLCLTVETSCASSAQNVFNTTAVSDSSHSNDIEANSLPSHGYSTRKKRISFRQMHLGLSK